MDNSLTAAYQTETESPFVDSLTGLFNHGFFQINLEREIDRCKRDSVTFSLALIDVDGFSMFNKRCGHLTGDKTLKQIATLIHSNVRTADLSARFGGDVFAAILINSEKTVSYEVAERIRKAVVNDTKGEHTVSIGLASFPDDAHDHDTILHQAHKALMQAKSDGKNRVSFFKKEPPRIDNGQSVVLVVDDEPKNAKLMEAILAPLNFTIQKATNGQDALNIIKKTKVDLVLLDVMMPGMSGYDVCRRIKNDDATRLIPIILVTALDDNESKIKGIEAGADDFISKPVDRAEIIARTKSLVRVKQLNSNLTSIENVLFSLAGVVEAKDSYTQGHTNRVANLAVSLGQKMGVSPTELAALKVGGVLHDIGKIGVSREILNKPGPLDKEEWEIMQTHPVQGYNICLPLGRNLGPALHVIRHHHEKLDGSGYPDQLKADEISTVARIMAVVDIFDALVTDRPYRKAMPREKAFAILREEAAAGKLDQDVTAHLIEMIANSSALEATASC